MREMELVTLACGLGSFPYIAFPPVAFPDPDYCSSDKVLDLEAEPEADPPQEPPEPPEPEPQPEVSAEPPAIARREPVLARMLPLAAPVEPVELIAKPAPVEPAAPSFALLEELNEPASDPVLAPYPLLRELHSTVGRPTRRPPRRDSRCTPKPAARVALAKAQQN